jgi:prophage antirepressor-like protein
MNELQIFPYKGSNIRTIQFGGEIWWVLKDVCMALGISNSGNVAKRLDDFQKDIRLMDIRGGEQKVTVVSESGLYSIVFRSDKEVARNFERWVTSEVLPSIRKTGNYNTQPQVPQNFADALQLAADQQRQIEAQSQKLIEQQPKVAFHDKVARTDKVMSFRDVTALQDIRPKCLMKLLEDNKYIYRNQRQQLRAYAHSNKDYFRLKKVIGRDDKAYDHLYVTNKGLQFIGDLIDG